MRATRVLRCTRCTGSSSGRRSAWTLRHFWDERAYNAAPGGNKTLATVAVMAALGFAFNTSTSNAPGTVIGSDGTLQYGAHNLFLNATAPATQTITVTSGAVYTIWATGTDRI